MRTLSHLEGIRSNIKARSSSPIASEASTSSKITQHPIEVDVKPVSSTLILEASEKAEKPFKISESDRLLDEVNVQHKPMIAAEAQRRINNLDIDLHEASLPTNGEYLNPARDGVFSRVRSIILRFGAAAVIGGTVGAGGSSIVDHFVDNQITTTSEQATVDDVEVQI